MLYFALASIISADNNNSVEEINNNLKNLRLFKKMLFDSDLNEKENLLKVCDDGFKILSKDLLTFETK